MEVRQLSNDFKTLEEVKEFITNPENNGVITCVNKADGSNFTMTTKEFIEKVGLENATNFFYENQNNLKAFCATGNKEDMKELVKKFVLNPDSLTEDEKCLVMAFLDSNVGVSEGDYILSFIIKTFVEYGKECPYATKFGGMLAVVNTLLAGAVALNSEDDPSLYSEKVNSVAKKIILPEGVDDEILLAGLLHLIGDRFIIEDCSLKYKEVKFRKIAEALNLNTDFIFNEGEYAEEENEE